MDRAASDLSPYAGMLEAYHRGFDRDLAGLIAELPLPPNALVLDLACGDGSFGRWFVERGARPVGVDILLEYLRRARDAVPGAYAAGDAGRLPFRDGAFDAAWCAQSFYSLPSAPQALREMLRVVRPEGLVAVLENDTFHHILLPWPEDVEVAVRRAELQALSRRARGARRFYVARRLRPLLQSAGLKQCRTRTFAWDRHAPFGEDVRRFLAAYLEGLVADVLPFLRGRARADFEALAAPGSTRYLLDKPDITITCLDRVAWGFKPPNGGQP